MASTEKRTNKHFPANPPCCEIEMTGLVVDTGVIVGYQTGREILDQTVRIGTGAHMRSGTIIYVGTNIGKRLSTGHNVIIREENQIGDDFTIWSNSVVDYGCKIGADVKIHTNCYISQFSTIEDHVFVAPGASFANDFHPGCPRFRECMKGPTIKEGAKIGLNVTILPDVTIGAGALIGAGAVVTRNVPDETVAVGNPARSIGSVYDLKCHREILRRPYG